MLRVIEAINPDLSRLSMAENLRKMKFTKCERFDKLLMILSGLDFRVKYYEP